ncbi:MAG: putative type IX secretion system sortase PorU2 [Bacteroidia bacterium]
MRTNKNILIAILFLLTGFGLYAQTDKYNNRWINHSQRYFKIKIPQDGIYRLDSATIASTLATAGVSLDTINPQKFQLFQRGVQIYPYIYGEGDGKFNTGDYILFYAEKNKATHDSLLYVYKYNGTGVTESVPFLTNPFYSVTNDTAAVFLTWGNSTGNLRLNVNAADTNYISFTPSPYYYKEAHSLIDPTSISNGYDLGPLNVVNQSDPRYRLGEGIVSYLTEYEGETRTFTIPTAFAYKSTVPAYFTFCISGRNDIAGVYNDHIYQFDYTDNTSAHQYFPIDSSAAYTTRRYTYTVNPNNFGPSTDITVSNLNNPGAVIGGMTYDNMINVNYIQAYYPHQFNMLSATEEKIYLPDDGAQTESYLSMTAFGGSSPVLIDVTNHRLITIKSSGGNFQALVPNSGGTKYCYLADQSKINNVTSMAPVNRTTATPGYFANYFTNIYDSVYIMVTHSKLMKPGMHGVNDYKAWRSGGPGGGNFNVLVANAEDLADQYCYGVDRNPLGIRNFCSHLIDTAMALGKKRPSNLFLIGKGIHPQDMLISNYIFLSPSACANVCLVPTWGNPASDILITQGLPGSLYLEPAIPTGRLAAQNDADILAYLSKAELHQTQTGEGLWKKQAIHFIGGNDRASQTAFDSYMTPCAKSFKDTAMGGQVFTFRKTTSAPTSVTTNDSVRQLIDAGVSLLTFFGHGSPSGFDENIDDPQTYNNSPHFPFVLANSCFTGDINSAEQLSHSEVFTLAQGNHGGIGYVATVSEGVANYLAPYSWEMYSQMCSKNYGKSYGTSLQQAVKAITQTFVPSSSTDSIMYVTCMEMTLHGDPAINSYGFGLPDYTLTNADVSFNTTKWVDSIGIKIVMTNQGRGVAQQTLPFVVMVQRTFPNGDILKWNKIVKPPKYRDTLSFFIPMDYYRAVGKNDFTVSLDDNHAFTESNENNNTAGPVSLFIKGADIEPVWPYKFAIVPDTAKVVLKASTADPFAPVANYIFQVDTNDRFISPLTSSTVTAPGGVVSLPLTLYGNKDSTVYFWRVKKDSDSNAIWKESSFQVLKGKYGWGQAHFHQFRHDQFQYVTYDTLQRNYDFYNTIKTISVNNIVCYYPWINFDQVEFYFNGNREQQWSCAPNGWAIAKFNPVTADLIPTYTVSQAPDLNGPFTTYYGPLGECICDLGTMSVVDFGNYNKCDGSNYLTNDYRDSLADYINNIPDSTPVLAYAVKYDDFYMAINQRIIDAMKSIGSRLIDSLKDTTTMIIFGKKGWPPGRAHEVISHSRTEFITLKDSLTPNFTNGYIASDIIGPCKYSDTAWGALHWNYHSYPSDMNITDDSIYIQLIGIDKNGNKYTLANFDKTKLDVLNLSTYVNGKNFPYIQLVAIMADTKNNTPPQLTRWQVIFDQAPECAIHPPAGFSVVKNPVSEGENYEVHVPIKNISDFSFDSSLVVTYNVQDANRVGHQLADKLKRAPFKPDSVLMDTIVVNTLGLAGSDMLWVDVNPPVNPKYQYEQFHFNNIAQISFDVNRDKINPMLDVTFDGIHILNRDIVSSKPNILVSLKDENKFLAMNDTSSFDVYLLMPDSSHERRLNFVDNTLLFTPAQLPNNSCKINYHPTLHKDGTYTLHIKSKDKTGNRSGAFDYRIQFDVINKPSITEILNYPNPFSTATKFVFTITGSEVPETFKIQIITITGRVVKEINKEELGFLHIGRNITDFAWDGKDQFGDQLANGVYLYRVQTRLNGNEMDHMKTDADAFFKKGYGKMLLMR